MTATAAKFAEDLPESYQSSDNFADIFENQLAESAVAEGSVVEGTIISLTKDHAVVDVGLKSEGFIPLSEFGRNNELAAGDKVEVFVDRYEDRNGEIVLSREKAQREAVWEELEKACAKSDPVNGTIFNRVKGGFTVDLDGAIAFLPGSQVDIRPAKDITPLMNVEQPFLILKMDRKRGNIIVSRRAIMEESRSEARTELLNTLSEGTKLEGIVKNVTDYGAFVDLGGIDGLLHVTDMSWKRINHPSDMLKVGDSINVIVTKYDEDSKRVSLGMKQLEENPWDEVAGQYTVGEVYTGRISNVTDYGAFVELGEGIEGLVHVSEMSWTKKNLHPNKIVSPSEEVKVMVLDIDRNKHRISLGIKQTEDNPWNAFADKFEAGQIVEGEVRNITDFGLFVGLEGDIDGLVHYSDISWEKSGEEAVQDYKKGDIVKARILGIDIEKERISLGIKQLEESAASEAIEGLAKGATVTCTVTDIQPGGIEVQVEEGLKAFVKKSDLSRDRQDQRPDRFAVGDRVDAKITSLNKREGKMNVSIKALEMDQHKQAIEEYGSAESGASLGDILGAALNEAEKKKK